jgi:hypothetical protein
VMAPERPQNSVERLKIMTSKVVSSILYIHLAKGSAPRSTAPYATGG